MVMTRMSTNCTDSTMGIIQRKPGSSVLMYRPNLNLMASLVFKDDTDAGKEKCRQSD